MKKQSWILFVICVVVFFTLRLLSGRHGTSENNEKQKPYVPEPVAAIEDPLSYLPLEKESLSAREHFASLLSHGWILAQPSVSEINIEMVRDLSAFEQFCQQVCIQKTDYTMEQVEDAVIQILTDLQEQVPYDLPDDLYNVICIGDMPPDWIEAPVPFHVYKRLYLGDTELGFPIYLDVRVFEPGECPVEDVITWHLQALSGEPICLHRTANRSLYISNGFRTRDTAHGFAQEERGLFLDCIEKEGQLFVLHTEAPIEIFNQHKPLFEQLIQEATHDQMDDSLLTHSPFIWE